MSEPYATWSTNIKLPNAGSDTYTSAHIGTNGYGVYVNLTRVDKHGQTHTFLLFPEQIGQLMGVLPEAYKQAIEADVRIDVSRGDESD